MAVPLALLAAPAIIQGGIGLAQLAKGASMNPKRPEYEVPESAEEALANAKYVASQTALPGADIFRSSLKENMANSIFNLTQAATSPTQILEGITKMNEEYANQEQKLAMQAAQNYYNNQGQLRGELNNMAAREDQKWIANEYNPWLMDMERKQGLMEGGMHNIMGGVSSGASLLGAKAQMDFLGDIYGNKGETPPTTTPPTTMPPMATPYINPMTMPQFNSNTPSTFGDNPFGSGKTTPLTPTQQPFQPQNDFGTQPNSMLRNPFKF